MLTGLYVPGTSLAHRTPAGVKLALLVVGSTLLMVRRSPTTVVIGTVLVATAHLVARIGARRAAAQLAPLRWILVALAAIQAWLTGWVSAVVLVGTVALVVLAASLVTLTTTTTDLVDAMVRVLRPLRPVGVDPDRVALVLGLTMRAIPVLARMADEVRQAQRARGCERSVRAFVGPVAIRTIRYADRVGEALSARGVDDP